MWWIKKDKTKEEPDEIRIRNQRFYNSTQWYYTRLAVLSNEPLCRSCLVSGLTTSATDVDHIKPLRYYYHLRYSVDNLQPLCFLCHIKKSKEEKNYLFKKKIDDRMNELDDF